MTDNPCLRFMPEQLRPLKIGQYVVEKPIVLGAMSIRITGAISATAGTKCGIAGTIGGVGRGYDSVYFKNGTPFLEANALALRDELQLAKEIDRDGVYGVNILVAATDYRELVKVAAENGAKYIVSGAGLPTDLPALTKDHPEVAIIPIVSSVQGLRIICKRWWNNHQRLPDAVVIENPMYAGGHLGVTPKQDMHSDEFKPEIVLPGSRAFLQEFLDKIGKPNENVSLIAGGGAWDGLDINKLIALGADGVQMATRFVGTQECEAPPAFKQKYLDAKPEDIITITSPVGIPGRAIKTEFLERVARGEIEDRCIVGCLESCKLRETGETYCIVQALSRAYRAEDIEEIEDGLVFAGSNVWRLKEQGIVPMSKLVDELCQPVLH